MKGLSILRYLGTRNKIRVTLAAEVHMLAIAERISSSQGPAFWAFLGQTHEEETTSVWLERKHYADSGKAKVSWSQSRGRIQGSQIGSGSPTCIFLISPGCLMKQSHVCRDEIRVDDAICGVWGDPDHLAVVDTRRTLARQTS